MWQQESIASANSNPPTVPGHMCVCALHICHNVVMSSRLTILCYSKLFSIGSGPGTDVVVFAGIMEQHEMANNVM